MGKGAVRPRAGLCFCLAPVVVWPRYNKKASEEMEKQPLVSLQRCFAGPYAVEQRQGQGNLGGVPSEGRPDPVTAVASAAVEGGRCQQGQGKELKGRAVQSRGDAPAP